ncbi:transcriptional regulator [Kitasatospora sp. MAP5-34]|uniref:telomere-associated protein Tap n=1 Tax=Kitasatospora sp. MAP5-34 TaxID=3035102 RepID=UPI0032AF37A3
MPDSLFDAVDALLARSEAVPDLPSPAERQRLREAGQYSTNDVAKALQVRRETLERWETGATEPRSPKREAYLRLLAALAVRHGVQGDVRWLELADEAGLLPAPAAPAEAEAAPAPAAAPQSAPAPCVRCGVPTPFRAPDGSPLHLGGFCQPPAAPTPPAAPAPTPLRAPARTPVRTPGPPAVHEPVQPAAAAKYPAGPLAVLDLAPSGPGLAARLADGRTLDVPARTLPELTEWALTAGLGSARLHKHGKDGDPLVVLTDAAAELLGLPPAGRERSDYDRRTGRLPETHRVVKALTKAGWLLTKRGFGPWARVYRTPDGGRRECVQYCVPAWGALSTGGWAVPEALDAADLARLLGTYAARVITPRGSTAVSGLELMTALRPPTRAVRTESGWASGPVEGSLTHAVDPAPPEAPAEHPVAEGRDPEDVLDEEAWDWYRPIELVDDREAALPWVVGLDINTAFLAAAGRLLVGLSEPVHELEPRFDKKIPGSWLCDFSDVELDLRLPNPFTPTGDRPLGPAWYSTVTAAYAAELGATVQPLAGWLRHASGPYLDPWHKQLRAAYVTTMDRLGVPLDLADRDPEAFLRAMAALRDGDPVELAVLHAVKATAKGGIGKLRERPQGAGYRPGQRWAALDRPTWRPDIRAAVIATARINMHRKLRRMASDAGRYPLAVLSDCAVYPADGPSPLDALRCPDDTLSTALRLGVSPGHVKHEGTQPMREVLALIESGTNPARHIKTGVDAVAEGE